MTRKSLKKILGLVSFIFAMGSGISTHNERHLNDPRKQFIQEVIKSAWIANAEVANLQQNLNKLQKKFLGKGSLSPHDLDWLSSTAAQYGLSVDFHRSKTLKDPEAWKKLESRIDTVPFSLILAQAIYESDWGNSRFAREGNNYFGQRCFTPGCGIIPKQRNENETFEMKAFDNMTASIKSYVFNLNTNSTYEQFRTLRHYARLKKAKIDGLTLAETLAQYAEQNSYAQALQSIIRKYDLTLYDQELEKNISDKYPH